MILEIFIHITSAAQSSWLLPYVSN